MEGKLSYARLCVREIVEAQERPLRGSRSAACRLGRRGFSALVVAALALLALAIACAPAPALAAELREGTVPMYRLYNRWSGEHLFTTDESEYDGLGAIGWDQEGTAWNVPTEGSEVYRLYNPYSGDHFYTGSRPEYDALHAIGWNQEGVAFRSADPEGGVPIYRLYNKWLTQGTHLFTTKPGEYGDLEGIGWSGEDVAFYGVNGTYEIRVDLGDKAPDADAPSAPATYTDLSGDVVVGEPTHEDYEFRGWSVDGSDETQMEVTIPQGSNGDVDLEATWAPKSAVVDDAEKASGVVSYKPGIDSVQGEVVDTAPSWDAVEENSDNRAEVTVRLDNSRANEVKVGDILVVNSRDALNGASLTVEEITWDGNTMVAKGSVPSPDQVFQKIDIQGEATLSADDLDFGEGVTISEDGEPLYGDDREETNLTSQAIKDSGSRTFKEVKVKITEDTIMRAKQQEDAKAKKGEFLRGKHSFMGQCSGELDYEGGVTISCTPSFDYRVEWDPIKGFDKKSYVKLASDMSVDGTVGLKGTGTIHLWSGPKTSPVQLDMDLVGSAECKVRVAMSGSESITSNFDGYKFPTLSNSGFQLKDAVVGADGEMAIGPDLFVGIKIGDVSLADAGLEFRGKARGRETIRSTELACLDAEGWITLDARLMKQSQTLDNAVQKQGAKTTYHVWNSKHKKQHFENWEPVDACTWKESGGESKDDPTEPDEDKHRHPGEVNLSDTYVTLYDTGELVFDSTNTTEDEKNVLAQCKVSDFNESYSIQSDFSKKCADYAKSVISNCDIYVDTSYIPNLFNNLSHLTSIEGLSRWNVSGVESMGSFFGCTNLADLSPIGSWDVSNVKSMGGTFDGCSHLTDLSPISNWDVSNATDMSSMFLGTSVSDLSPISNWDVSNVADMAYMFEGCSLLSNEIGLSGWNVSHVRSFENMFANCTSLVDLSSLSSWDTSNVTDMDSLFSGCTSLSDVSPLADWNVSRVTSMAGMFEECSALSNISGLSHWDVSNVCGGTSDGEGGHHFSGMDSMFNKCKSLADISALASWDVSGGPGMFDMFNSCESLTDISPLAGWNVSHVTDMAWMFYHSSIQDLAPLASWDVSNVTDMSSMFDFCIGISDISPLARWDVSSVTLMDSMFDCLPITNVSGLSSWNVSRVTSMKEMFSWCRHLVDVSGLSSWDVSKVQDTSYMFDDCDSVSDFSALNSWNVSGSLNMNEMFRGCYGSLPSWYRSTSTSTSKLAA